MKKSNKSEILKNNTSAKKTNTLVKPTILQKGKILNNKTKVIYFVTQHDQKNINKRKIEFGTNFFKKGKVCTSGLKSGKYIFSEAGGGAGSFI